jgi:2-dehydro-3-deoxyphosphogalactonate aldolase
MSLSAYLKHGTPPIIAILRGMPPNDAVGIGRALIDAGIRLIEVPLNSPQPLESIARLHAEFSAEALIGAGTVLGTDAVNQVATAGGKLVLSPITDGVVITRALELGLEPVPGFMSATEALAAVNAGARHLKLFPAHSLGAGHIRSVREILPVGIDIWAVGGTSARDLSTWLERGACGIGVGGSLYKPGDSAAVVAQRARELVAAWRAISPVAALPSR